MVTDIVSDMVEESWCILQSWQSSKKVNKKKLHFHWSTELVFLYFFATLRINVLLTRSNYYKLNSKALTSSEYNKQNVNTGKKTIYYTPLSPPIWNVSSFNDQRFQFKISSFQCTELESDVIADQQKRSPEFNFIEILGFPQTLRGQV